MSIYFESSNLFLTPSLDTALQHAIDVIHAKKAHDPLAPVHLLLPDHETGTFVQRCLGNTLNIRTFSFNSLSRIILGQARQRYRYIDDTTVRRLVHYLLTEMAERDELSTFADVWEKPGFVEATVDWLHEMKTQGIEPVDFSDHAARHAHPHESQLALLFTRYQAFLHERRASDTEGALWLAAEALDADPGLFVSDTPLMVMAFDQFTPMQMRILNTMKERSGSVLLYLPWASSLPHGSLALSRLSRTRTALEPLRLNVVELTGPSGDGRPAAFRVLGASLFESDSPLPNSGDETPICAVEAPSREEEVRWTLRAVKALRQQGAASQSIAIYAPQPALYQRVVATVAQEYGVPIEVERPLVAEPPISALLNLLQLSDSFPRRQTFDALRSPYVKQVWFDAADISLLDRLTRERPVVAGRDQWLFALQPARAMPTIDDEDRAPTTLVATLPVDKLERLSASIGEFFDHLTPPAKATTRDYVVWIQDTMLGLVADDGGEETCIIAPLHLSVDDELGDAGKSDSCAEGRNRRENAALRRFLGHLRRLVMAADLLPAADTMEWPAFHQMLVDTLAPMLLQSDQIFTSVPFHPLSRARMVSADYVFVLGLGEGEFPSAPPWDIFYSAVERERHPLKLAERISGDDASLWWQVIANTRRQLTLSRPWLDEHGAPWPASPYWRAVTERLEGASPLRIAVAHQIDPAEAAGNVELLTALAARHAAVVPPTLQAPWQDVQIGSDLIAKRNGRRPPDIYEGVLRAPDIVSELAQRYGSGHIWSVSRLNRYNSCPFGFFAETVLQLAPEPEPEEGLDALQRGSLLHEILEDLYRELGARSLAVMPESKETVLSILYKICAETFPTAPSRYGFRPGPLWRHEQTEIARLLTSLMSEACENGNGQFMPYLQEMDFGLGGERPAARLSVDGYPSFRLRGLIDRVDRDAAGRLCIVDYKSGSSPYSKRDIELGVALQTALYAWVAEQLLTQDAGVASSYYLHIPSRKSSGKLSFGDGPAGSAPLVQTAVACAAKATRFVQLGLFPAAPAKTQGDACSAWCRLAPICRLSRRATVKGRRLLEEMSDA